MKILVWKGRGITAAVKDSGQTINWLAPDIIMVVAGICDLTTLDRETRQVSLSFSDEHAMLDEFTGKMDIIQHHLKVIKLCQSVKYQN